MVRAMRQQLDAWRDDPAVTRVIVIGARRPRVFQPAATFASGL